MPTTASTYPDLAAARSAENLWDEAPRATVLAGGVLPWRLRSGELEVLIIHRPRYDDWSWPKGKLDDGETLPECAVRETLEEIGLDIRLGIPLPVTHYRLKSGAAKEVWYWAAEVTKQEPAPDHGEVDRVAWVSPQKARKKLSNTGDLTPLDALEQAHVQRRLRTTPFVVLRHAKAKPRSSWTRAEGERPLAATGRRQALAVRALLQAWKPVKVASSPWRRCVETVAPYVQSSKRSLKEIGALTEKKADKNPKRARRELAGLLDRVRPQLVCMQRPVLPLALQQLRTWTIDAAAGTQRHSDVVRALPVQDPYLRPGGVIVAHQAVELEGQIVALEVYDAYDG